MQGLDAPTLGAQWQAMAGTAPQFHENHVLSGSVAFNLLMGRQWPAGPAALAEAQSVCDALGLGELLQRMPAGLHQRIGETGWQLSHGERSRLFLARALLQGAPLTVLDESFAALDPETLARCLRAVQPAHADAGGDRAPLRASQAPSPTPPAPASCALARGRVSRVCGPARTAASPAPPARPAA